MIHAKIDHIQFNVDPQNLTFYKDLFAFVGWETIHEGATMLGVGDGSFSSLWFLGEIKDVKNDYDGAGMNHLALQVKEQNEVDEMVAYLQERNIPCLFETPRHRPEFSSSDDQTYYQVMFETPDKILLEVVYMGLLGK